MFTAGSPAANYSLAFITTVLHARSSSVRLAKMLFVWNVRGPATGQ